MDWILTKGGKKMPKTLTTASVPTYKRTLQSVGKAPFVSLSFKSSEDWSPYLHTTRFKDKKTGKRRRYTPKTISHKMCAMRRLYSDYNIRHILLDIYQNPSRVSIRVRKKAGKRYETLVPGTTLPPMIIKKTKKIKKLKKVGSKIRKK